MALNATPKTLQYNSFKLLIMKSMLIVAKADAESLAYSFSENATHYILEQSNQIPNNRTTIRAQNVFSTLNSGSITLTTYQSGYKVETNQLELPATKPLLLGASLSCTNRTVGQYTNLTISVDRNNNGGYGETQITIDLPTNGFSYTSATYSGTPIDPTNPKVTIPVTITSPRVLSVNILNLQNMLYLPSAGSTDIQPIKVYTKKGTAEVIGASTLSSSLFIPNDATDVVSVATRSNDQSGEQTNVTIVYNTQYGKSGDTLEISLPEGQNSYVGSSSCLMGDQPCHIYSSNATFIAVEYIKGKTVTLAKLINYHPNENKLKITLKTSSSNLIE